MGIERRMQRNRRNQRQPLPRYGYGAVHMILNQEAFHQNLVYHFIRREPGQKDRAVRADHRRSQLAGQSLVCGGA